MLNTKREMNRNSSLENVHTFYLKKNSIDKSIMKSNSNHSLNSEQITLSNKRYESTITDNEPLNPAIYVEERVKFQKSGQEGQIYRSLKEL